jgi:hypothetical protein
VYRLLYRSMVACYKRQRTYASGPYLYAATMLSILAMANIVSIIVIGAHLHLAWALKLFAIGKSRTAWVGLAVVLYVLHVAYARWRGEQTDLPSRWIANTYTLASAVLFYYAFMVAPHPV